MTKGRIRVRLQAGSITSRWQDLFVPLEPGNVQTFVFDGTHFGLHPDDAGEVDVRIDIDMRTDEEADSPRRRASST